MTIYFADDFNGDLSKWSYMSTNWSIVNGRLISDHGYIDSIPINIPDNFVTTITFNNDGFTSAYYLEFVLFNDDWSSYLGFGMDIDPSAETLSPYLYGAGSDTVEGSPISINLVEDISVEISLIRTILTTKINGVIVQTSDVNTVTGGIPPFTGFEIYTRGNLSFDNLIVETATSPPTSTLWDNIGIDSAITASFTETHERLIVNFTDTSTHNPTSWLWNFGDGTTSTDPSPIHAYTNGGPYDVTLTVTDIESHSSTRIITLPSLGPHASFTSNVTAGQPPLIVNFEDTSTYNPSRWQWDFGDGTTSTEQHPTHVYITPGSYNVILKVIDENCDYGTVTEEDYITVQYIKPIAGFTSDDSPLAPSLTINFKDISSNYPTSWDWDFGDGSEHSTSQNPSHTYEHTGTYPVILTVSNPADSDSITEYITARPAVIVPPTPETYPPEASFETTGNEGEEPFDVFFTDTSTNNPTSWLWDFGDGTTSTEQYPHHIYFNDGIYAVTLRATNNKGSDTTESISITVAPTTLIHLSQNFSRGCPNPCVSGANENEPISPVSKGIYHPDTGEWIIGDLVVGETVTLRLEACPLTSGLNFNITDVSANELEIKPSNNYKIITIDVKKTAKLAVNITFPSG